MIIKTFLVLFLAVAIPLISNISMADDGFSISSMAEKIRQERREWEAKEKIESEKRAEKNMRELKIMCPNCFRNKDGLDETVSIARGLGNKGHRGIVESGCVSPWKLQNGGISGGRMSNFDVRAQVKACELAKSTWTGASGLDCATCSGNWQYGGMNFTSNNLAMITHVRGIYDGVNVNVTNEFFSIASPDEQYSITYALTGNGFLQNTFGGVTGNTGIATLSEINHDNAPKDITVTNVKIPAEISSAIQTMSKKRGVNIKSNDTYKVINDIFLTLAKTKNINGLTFAKDFIFDPLVAKKIINDYYGVN